VEPDRGPSTLSVDTVRLDPLGAVIKVVGVIDMSTAAALWAVLQGHLAAGRRFLRLDLSGVTLLDATALTGITRAHHDLLRRRGTLVITGVHSLVSRVLRVTGLDELLFVSGPRADHDWLAGQDLPQLATGLGDELDHALGLRHAR
jgi:anti-sigma B factor antagonist